MKAFSCAYYLYKDRRGTHVLHICIGISWLGHLHIRLSVINLYYSTTIGVSVAMLLTEACLARGQDK